MGVNFSFLKKNKLANILVIVQLVFSLFIFILMGTIVENSLSNYFTEKSILGDNVIVKAPKLTGGPEPDDYSVIYQWLLNNEDIKGFGTFVTNGFTIDNLVGNRKLAAEHVNNGSVTVKYIDEPFNNSGVLKLVEGRNFLEEEFDELEGSTPIIVGHGIGQDFPVGSILQSSFLRESFEIVGVLKEGHQWVDTNSANRVLDASMLIIAPNQGGVDFSDDDEKVWFYNSIFINLKDNADKEGFINEINELFSFISFDTLFSYHLYLMEIERRIGELIIIVLLLTLTLIGFGGTLMESILRRRKEFGIKLAIGASKRRITLDFYKEVMVIFAIALGANILFYTVFFKMLFPSFSYSWLTMLTSVLLIFFLSLFTALIPIMKILKLQPVEIIRGR